MPGVILAGISGAGKTSTYQRLLAVLAQRQQETLFAVPQAMTTTAHLHLAHDPAAQAAAVLDWCTDVIGFVERTLARAHRGGLTTHRRHWTPLLVAEGFVYDIPLHDFAIDRARIRPLEHRLATLNIALVLLSVPDERVLEQCVHSTRATRGEGWARYLAALGEDDEARAEYFRAAQRRLWHWAVHSPLPTLNIDTSQRQWDDYALAAANYVTALTGSA
ncbi:MAG: hypothetical protein ACRDRW_03355 [Pseudonocardiaceae bacterium]